jgi:hypothetical protein
MLTNGTDIVWPAAKFSLDNSSCPSNRRLQAAAPKTTQAAAPADRTSDEPDDQQERDSTDGSVDDHADDSGAKMNAKLRHQPFTDKRANNADDHVAKEPKANPLHDVTGQKPGGNANEQDDKETFV